MSIEGLIIFNAIYLYIVYFIILFYINVMFRFGYILTKQWNINVMFSYYTCFVCCILESLGFSFENVTITRGNTCARDNGQINFP